nr:hypothetical protein [Tanacetum cinerariifolium]
MDDPNITMEEYIRLEEEKAQRHGRTFNWQTATFGKVKHYEDEDDCSIDFKTEFPAIVFDNKIIPSEPKVCPPNESEFDFRISLDKSDDEDYTRHPWLIYEVEGYTPGIVHSYEQRLETIWSRLDNQVYVLDFAGLTPKMRQDLVVRLRMVYSGEGQQVFGHAPEKVTSIDLFYLRSMDRRTINVPHILAQYLFRHADERKSRARLSGGHFIGHLDMHFGLGPKRQQAVAAGTHEDDEAGLAAEEVAEEIPAPAQAPPPLPQPWTMS